MQDGGTSRNKNTSTFETIVKTIAFILSLMTVLIMVSGCTANQTSTEPQPLEPEETIGCTDIEVDKKPVIYLYPEELMGVNVILGKPENITCAYPEYNFYGWGVMAYPNGDLVDEKTGRELYALYYECKNPKSVELAISGFVVAKEDTISFLEEKLAILGLSEHEAEEFIIYWLPELLKSDYNYIRFASMEEINEIMPLTVKPTPDTVIRILMYFKGLDYEMQVNEQELTPVTREGFTVVEWGGQELQNVMPWRVRMPCGGIHVPRIRLPKLGRN